MVCITYVNGMFGTAQFSVVFMKQNQNSRHNRQGRPGQNNNQKRSGKSRHNQNWQPQPNSPTRQMDSRGPSGNQRGNAKQLYERYKMLAQEKRISDRLEAESLFQYADHYYRIYSEFAAAEAATQAAKEKSRQEEQAKKEEAEAVSRAAAAAKEKTQSSEPELEKSEQKPPRKPRRKQEEKADDITEQTPESAKTEPESANP